ncbi:MAG: acyl-CoA thioesterase [Acidobacteriota bacterium]|nr:MAG: acyl-CoA thioesterase [Acidobacteriota bacterium]
MSTPDTDRRTPEISRVVMTTIVMPADTNNYGHIFGGRVLAMADKVAAMAAMRHCRLAVVTASIDRVDFIRPIKSGMIIILTGEVNAAFTTSLEVGVRVEAEDPITGHRIEACRALITLVAIDRAGHPVRVPKLEFDTDEQRERAQRAQQRRKKRLATRDAY